ncbi:Rieske (2Fe-2S) protein [Cyanobacterium aponinum UTEX 3222]|uniref:Rieske (2Fe-2S) iron-sulfur domain protein n=1 Tax=Cyanobacterium aponinum (strain PCC 10605) TaxID=755178 RepID=K9Z3N2_CYAAP|nr:Rieske (2Fe-2S) protein [Cyanobacterium aponinum]AFZ53734.1 Rieske (2Fe-2S) iron-sulfur domain protein [Cyanobacterium aponinum PCC 10605]MBD2395910.1 Rieske (2Fe-2S) protein [Cyanobacterium aponinum FACHB-4101]WRL41363.1 Rieske (2Fe-2S) protein [Cyanobacterium aponinum UTEX 3222]
MKRRRFFSLTLFSFIFTTFLPVFHKVFAQETENNFYKLGSLTDLEENGFLLNENLEIGAVLVILKEDNSLIAIEPTCTHMGCLVEWNKQENLFICPCHNSKFQEDGKVVEGLAISDLPIYQVKIENNTVFVANQ